MPQGCNLALESVGVLAQVLDKEVPASNNNSIPTAAAFPSNSGSNSSSRGLEALPERFTAARLADAHALQQLEMLVVVSSMKPGAWKGRPGVVHPLVARFMLLSALIVSMLSQKVQKLSSAVKGHLAPWLQQRQQHQWEKQQLQLLSKRGRLGMKDAKAKRAAVVGGGSAGNVQQLQQMNRPDVFGAGWASLLREPSVPYSEVWRLVQTQAIVVGVLLLLMVATVAAGLLKYMPR